MNEFELIRQYFARPATDAVLGVGDDAALLRPTPGCELHVAVDMLVEGRHFFADVDPADLGHKTLAVNLSDMAAMGAVPRWALLSLALPRADTGWVSRLASGLFALAGRHGVTLVGGDTTRGPLTLSLTILGEAPAGTALRRDGAREGDDIWVSGELGLAALALAHRLGTLDEELPDEVRGLAEARMDRPEPRVALGVALRGLAHSAIDVSDGLLADLSHIAAASGVAGEVWLDALPSHPWLEARRAWCAALLAAGGDDYELCFTAPRSAREAVLQAGARAGCRVSRIGMIHAGQGVELLDAHGTPCYLGRSGFDHFDTP